jgi:hypothetical protein
MTRVGLLVLVLEALACDSGKRTNPFPSMLRDAVRAATPELRRQGLDRLEAFPHETMIVRDFDSAMAGDQNAVLRLRYLQYALRHVREGERADFDEMIGASMRWDPSPEVRAAARKAACGSSAELEAQIATCPQAPSGCEAVAKCLPLYGTRAIALVQPWTRSEDPLLARLAADVVCGAISARYPNEWALDILRDDPGPWLGEALAILAADPPGSERGTCMDALAERSGLPKGALVLEPCGAR